MKKKKETIDEAIEWLEWFKKTPTYINMTQVCPPISLNQAFITGFQAAKGEYKK